MISNYPRGFSKGIVSREVPLLQAHTGQVFWVGNAKNAGTAVLVDSETAASDDNRGTFFHPFATLDYAVGKCVANRGDVIYIKPGYTQSMTAADAVDLDIAGITVIGLGRGTHIPKFTYDNSAGEFVFGAANVRIENLWFVPSVTGITKAVDVEAAADGYEIVGCRFADAEAAGTDEFLISIQVAAGADNGKILDNYIDMGTAGAATAITVATSIGTQIHNNVIKGDYSTANIAFITTAQVATDANQNTLINGVIGGLNTEPVIESLTGGELNMRDNVFACDVATFAAMVANWDAGINGGNRFTDDIGGGTTAVDRSATVVVSADG